MSEEIKLKRGAKGERPYFFDDPAVDKLLAMLMGLAGEVSVMRDRMDTIERLLQSKNIITEDEIENFQVSDEVLTQRAARREEFLSEITRIIEVELEAMQNKNSHSSYDEAIALVENDNE